MPPPKPVWRSARRVPGGARRGTHGERRGDQAARALRSGSRRRNVGSHVPRGGRTDGRWEWAMFRSAGRTAHDERAGRSDDATEAGRAQARGLLMIAPRSVRRAWHILVPSSSSIRRVVMRHSRHAGRIALCRTRFARTPGTRGRLQSEDQQDERSDCASKRSAVSSQGAVFVGWRHVRRLGMMSHRKLSRPGGHSNAANRCGNVGENPTLSRGDTGPRSRIAMAHRCSSAHSRRGPAEREARKCERRAG